MKKIINNINWLLIENAVRIMLGLFVVSIMARQLGVEQYGLFQYAISLVAIFKSITFICGAEILVPHLANANIEERQEIMGNAFIVRLLFSVVAFFALLLFGFFTEERRTFYLISLLGTMILFGESFGVVTAWLQSQTNSKPRSLLVMLSFSIKSILFGVLYLLGSRNPFYFATIYILDSLMIAVGLLFIFYKKTGKTFFKFSFPIAYGLFKKGLPFFWGLMAMFIFQRLDLIMLKKFADTVTLGYYAAALQLYNQVNVLAPILVMSLAPLLVYKISRIKVIKINVCKIVIIMFITAFIGAIIVQFLAPFFVPLLFGEEYQPSSSILCALAWVSCLLFINEGLNIYLLKIQNGNWITFKWIIVLIITFIAYWFFIPAYQAMGAIIGLALGYLTACVLGLYALLTIHDAGLTK